MTLNSRDDWFRNSSWDTETEAAFNERLARARKQKPQYLVIQAVHLTNSHPQVALELIERYFALEDVFHVSRALSAKATAHMALGDVDSALDTLKQAIKWEQDHRGMQTQPELEFGRIVACEQRREEYVYAVAALERDPSCGGPFATGRFLWYGAMALMASDLGDDKQAQQLAKEALSAASEQQSPFPRHTRVGLVSNLDDSFSRQVMELVTLN